MFFFVYQIQPHSLKKALSYKLPEALYYIYSVIEFTDVNEWINFSRGIQAEDKFIKKQC